MPKERRLTPVQKRIVRELDELMEMCGLDYWAILDRDPDYDPHRTIVLQSIMREIVRGEVITQYTLIDEMLGSKICHYMFPSKDFPKKWRSKAFQRFNYFILEKMSTMEKLAYVKDVYFVPKSISSDIEAINAIRNALAHAYLPENLRAYRNKKKKNVRILDGPDYKGVDVFTYDGVKRYIDDARTVFSFLLRDIKRKPGRKKVVVPAPQSDTPPV